MFRLRCIPGTAKGCMEGWNTLDIEKASVWPQWFFMQVMVKGEGILCQHWDTETRRIWRLLLQTWYKQKIWRNSLNSFYWLAENPEIINIMIKCVRKALDVSKVEDGAFLFMGFDMKHLGVIGRYWNKW